MKYRYTGSKPFLFKGRKIEKGNVIDVKLDGNFVAILEKKTKKYIKEEE